MKLSPNFTLEEMTLSQVALRQGIPNTPDDDTIASLERLCEELLEPARELLAVPLHVDSGYRSPALNEAVGGAANSAHVSGRAADVIPIGMDIVGAFERLRLSNLPYDQVIFECLSWIHIAIAPLGSTPRREALRAAGGPGHWTYSRV
jgi:zinc D-Ala-D-Ala carboxypeptidase